MKVALIRVSNTHKMSAPMANAIIPITPVRSDSPMIFRLIFQFFFLYSSLYLKMKDKKNPSRRPMVRKAEVLLSHSIDRLGKLSLGV